MEHHLYKKIKKITFKEGIEFGIGVRHIESGSEVMINADTLFILASVVKVPVLVEAFQQISIGRIKLGDRLVLQDQQKSLGSGVLTYLDNGLSITINDLLILMIIISDNTATDILMDHLKIDKINKTIQTLGIDNLHINLKLTEIFQDMLPSADPKQNRYELARYQFENGVNQKGIAYKRTSENNVGSARALTDLMEKIFKGEVVDRNACNCMLDILLKQQLNDRIPRDLPVGTPVAHKTGSFLGVRNDTGIIYVNKKSHVVVTVLSHSIEGNFKNNKQRQKLISDEIDKIIGEIASLAYNEFK